MTKPRTHRRGVEASPFISWSLRADQQVKKESDTPDTQTTQPLPLFFLRMQQAQWQKPTITQLRQVCGMSQYELAQASGVRYCRIAWMESGIRSSRIEIDKVLAVLSRELRTPYSIEDCQGIKVEDKQTSR